MVKKILSVFLLISLLVSPVTIIPAYADVSSGLDIWVENSLKTVYRTSTIPQSPQQSISIVSAMNEFESAQIALRSNSQFEITSVEFSDLASDKGIISSSNLSYHFEEYELSDTVKPNLFFPDRAGNPIYPKSELPDPLSNEASIQVSANSTQPIFITIYVPSAEKGTKAGLYTGTATVKTSLGDISVPVSVEVADVEIPKTSDANFVNFLWADTMGFTGDGFQWEDWTGGGHLYDIGKDYYGVETYSEDWWALMNKFAGVMTAHRQNMLLIRTDLLLQATGTKFSDFKTAIPDDIDWSVFDRYIQMFIDAGMTDFANIHLNHSVGKILEENYEDYSKVKDWNSITEGTKAKIDKFLENYLKALTEHLKQKGWYDGKYQWYQNITDEPASTYQINYWTYIAKKVKEYAPGLKTADADPGGVLMNDASKPYVDVWLPLTPAFQEKKSQYQAEQKAGKDMWVYTCESNQPPWLNRLWTQPTLTGRLLFWNLSQDNVTGHLHWGWNAWYVGAWYGDSTIVYPDVTNKTVKSSIRYEAQRDGIEEYELMYRLKQTNPELAKKIADAAVNPDDPRKYTLDTDYIRILHNYLVKAAAGENVGEVANSTGPYMGQKMEGTYIADSNDSDIQYSGKWFEKSRQFAYQESIKTTSAQDAFAKYEFNGTGVDVVVEKGYKAGKMAVYIDDQQPVIVDAYEKVQHDYFTIYSNRNLIKGKHTIKVLNLENKDMSIDCFRIQMYEGQILYNAALKSLQISNAPAFQFKSGVLDYKIVLDKGINEVSIIPELFDAGGTIEINGKSYESGMLATADIPLGKSSVNIKCTASDGVTTKQYVLNFLKGNQNTVDANVARSCTEITASAARTGQGGIDYGPQRMIDGNYGTMFASQQGYNNNNPFPHEIVMTWDTPKSFNTIMLATSCGLIQGITNVDVQIPDQNGTWTTIAENVPFKWKNTDSTYEIEYVYANIPAVSNVKKVRIQINDAYYTSWSMYAVYELELYNLQDNGECNVNISCDATLKSLELGNVSGFKFDSSIEDYRILIPDNVNTISITPKLTDSEGSISISGKEINSSMNVTADIPVGKSAITIKCTGRDGSSTKSYKLNLYKGIVNTKGVNKALSYSEITASAARGDINGEYEPVKMVDGSYNTEFASKNGSYIQDNPFPHNIDISWSEPQSINTLVLATFCGMNQGVKNVDIQVSRDGSTYEDVLTNVSLLWKNSDPDYSMEYTYINIPGLSDVNKMRIIINDANIAWSMYGIHELELYNLPDNGELAVNITYDTTLKSLELGSAGAFNFNSNITDYWINVPADTDTISLSPVTNSEGTNMTVNGRSMKNGMIASATIPAGKSVINIKVNAEDGITSTLYKLNILKSDASTQATNIATTCSAITASATRPGQGGIDYGPQKMIDGDNGTMFASLQGYNDTNPFPHEIALTWNEPQSLNTIMLATSCGLIQGITNIDVQIPDENGVWNTIAENIPFQWRNTDSTYEMEYAYANIPQVSDTSKLKIVINNANYTSWNMYAVYELALYNLKDNGEAEVNIDGKTYTISAKSGSNGSINPSGEVIVNDGGNQTFMFTPDKGYKVDKVLVDGSEALFVNNSYTFVNVTTSQAICVSFKSTETPTPEIPNPETPNPETPAPVTPSPGTSTSTTSTSASTPATVSTGTTVNSGRLVLKPTIDSSKTAKAAVTAENMQRAIDTVTGDVMIIEVNKAEGANGLEITLPGKVIDAEAGKKIEKLEINTEFATIHINTDVFKNSSSPDKDIVLSVKTVDDSALTEEVRKVIGTNPVYDFNLSAGGKKINKFSQGDIEISLDYTLKSGENPNNVVIYYVGDNGELQVVPNGRYNSANGKVGFIPKHFSMYATAYSNITFSDINNILWAKESIEALAARGIVKGTGNDRFKPDDMITRAEFITMLMSAFEFKENGTNCTFTDVKAGAWYYEAIAAAQTLGIVKGKPDGSFGVNDKISRQDMAVMTYKAACLLKLDYDNVSKAKFTDNGKISGYAAEAVTALQQMEVFNGNGGKFLPKDNSTRAQAAAVIYKLFKMV